MGFGDSATRPRTETSLWSTIESVFTFLRERGWLTLFAVLVTTQIGHFGEHIAQMVQLHALGLASAQAHGLVGSFDGEWAHFVFNLWILGAALPLVRRGIGGGWLRATAVLAGWHAVEHTYILTVYLRTGAGGAGLLAAGGALWGGLPLARPDLHFLYNLAETIPLLIAFYRYAIAPASAEPDRHRFDAMLVAPSATRPRADLPEGAAVPPTGQRRWPEASAGVLPGHEAGSATLSSGPVPVGG